MSCFLFSVCRANLIVKPCFHNSLDNETLILKIFVNVNLYCIVCIGTLLSQVTMVKHLLEDDRPSPGDAPRRKLYESEKRKMDAI